MAFIEKCMRVTAKINSKINEKLAEIEAKRLVKTVIKEEKQLQKTEKKIEAGIKRTRFVREIKLFFKSIVLKILIKIKKCYSIADYKKCVKKHKKLIKTLYKEAGISRLAKKHDNDLFNKENVGFALEGIEPPTHKYLNKHHLDYWVIDKKITEIPFENTLEIMCELFALCFSHENNTVRYDLVLELLYEKTEELDISNVIVDYFTDCINHAKKNHLIAPDYIYCKKTYDRIVLF